MLILTGKVNKAIFLDTTDGVIEIRFIEIQPSRTNPMDTVVKVGIEAPKAVKVSRTMAALTEHRERK